MREGGRADFRYDPNKFYTFKTPETLKSLVNQDGLKEIGDPVTDLQRVVEIACENLASPDDVEKSRGLRTIIRLIDGGSKKSLLMSDASMRIDMLMHLEQVGIPADTGLAKELARAKMILQTGQSPA